MNFKPITCKPASTYLKLLVLVCLLTFCNKVLAQSSFENALLKQMNMLLAPIESTRDELLPNPVLQSLTAPSGWGGYGNYVFGGIGGDYIQPYGNHPDFISFAGFCMGDPAKLVNVALSINALDVSKVSDFSWNLSVSRRIFTGSSISAGALQLFANPHVTDAPGTTLYVAFSHAIQSLPSLTQGSSKLTYTIGVGSGRFYRKSPLDIAAGRGNYGTAVFGSISYEILKWANANLEWSGMNLGCSLGIKPFENPLALGVGLTNLTRYSSNKVNASFVLCYPLSIKR